MKALYHSPRRDLVTVLGALGLAAGLGALPGCVLHTAEVAPPREVVVAEVVTEDDVDLDFEVTLAPHGTWLHTSTCGRVWRPHVEVVGVEFVPYSSGGEWVYTEYGWSFETDWDWDWAVFHYGRWCPDPAHGWVWVPGTVWASAWVEWRTGGGYVGWAPLLPAGMVHMHHHWSFVETRHFHDHRPVHHAVPPDRRHEVYDQTRPDADVVVHGSATWPRGPKVVDVSRDSGEDIRPAHVVPPAPGKVRRATTKPRPVMTTPARPTPKIRRHP